jgi:hypothetical protein
MQSLTDFNNLINALKLEDFLIGVMVYRERSEETASE